MIDILFPRLKSSDTPEQHLDQKKLFYFIGTAPTTHPLRFLSERLTLLLLCWKS